MAIHMLCSSEDTEFASQPHCFCFSGCLLSSSVLNATLQKKHTAFRKGEFHCKQTSLSENN